MTAAAEATPAPPTRTQRVLFHVAPALVLLAIAVGFLRYNEYSVLLPESLILIGGAAGIGILIGALSQLRPQTLAPMLMALVLAVYIFNRKDVSGAFLDAAHAAASYMGGASLFLGAEAVLLFLALCVACVLLRRNLELIVTAIFGTVVATTLLLPVEAGGAPVAAGAIPANLKDLPPVIHIILDEHIGLAGLPPEMPESEQAAQAIRETFSDFTLYSRAYSRFTETQFSLAALMNGSAGAKLSTLVRAEAGRYVLLSNPWFAALKEQGYALKVYQTDLLDMCSTGLADSCYTYPLFSVNAVQRSALSTMQRVSVLLRNMKIGRPIPLSAPFAANEVLTQFIADIRESPRGVAYVLHVLLPHEGFLFRPDCSPSDPAEWEGADRLEGLTGERRTAVYRMYLGQLICTESTVAKLFASLREAGIYDDATIIVHGDHGSRIGREPWITTAQHLPSDRDLVDHASTLFAFKRPGTGAALHTEPISLQDAFAMTFLGAPPRPDAGDGEVFIKLRDTLTFARRTLHWPEETADQVRVSAAKGAGPHPP